MILLWLKGAGVTQVWVLVSIGAQRLVPLSRATAIYRASRPFGRFFVVQCCLCACLTDPVGQNRPRSIDHSGIGRCLTCSIAVLHLWDELCLASNLSEARSRAGTFPAIENVIQ